MSEVAVSTELLPSQGAVVQCLSHRWLVEGVVLAECPDGNRVNQRGIDDQQVFGSYLNNLLWSCVTRPDPVLFQAPLRAGNGVKLIPARAPGKDDRGRADHARAATEVEGASRGGDNAALGGAAMEGGMESRFGLSFAVMVRQYITEMRLPRKPNASPDQIDHSHCVNQEQITA